MNEPPTYIVKLKDGKQFGPVSLATLVEWGKQGRVPRTAVLVEEGGGERSVAEVPELARMLEAPPTVGGALPRRDEGDDVTATVVPYRNKAALVGYYLAIFGGLFAIVPVLGFIMPIVAIVLGVKGRRAVKENPRVHGTVHAWIALIGGAIGVLLALVFTAMFVTVVMVK